MSLVRVMKSEPLVKDIEYEIWPRIKEVFGWASQHSALLGITFILTGTFVKSTRHTVPVLKPGIKLGPGSLVTPDDPRFRDWYDTRWVDGLDIPIWVLSTKAIQDAASAAATLAGGAVVTSVLNAIIPTLGNTPIVVIPVALLDPNIRNQYPDQNVFEISFRTSVIGSLIWPEPETGTSKTTTTVKDANGVVLLRLGDVFILSGLAMLFGGSIGNLAGLLTKGL